MWLLKKEHFELNIFTAQEKEIADMKSWQQKWGF